jgi:DNA-binding winged helix-turn-helix (wHTH) protein/TolB-like protein/Tfp pilus assembly protein PilF
MSDPVRQIFEFGPFRIDTSDRLLIRDGQMLPLPPKVIDTLLVLIGAGGRVVEKEELIKKVWPDSFVEEGGLARNVSLLRRTIGDTDEEPYIETIPRRGYRFVAPVRTVDEPESAVPAAIEPRSIETSPVVGTSPTPAASPSRNLRMLAVAALTLTLAGTVLWYLLHLRPGEASIVVMRLGDVSPEPQEYFAAGMTDAILTNLAKIKALKVVSYTAVNPERSGKAAARIAASLSVDAALEGSVLRAGKRVRITVRLLRAGSGEQTWAEEYEDDASDILQLQGSVARKIAEAIRVNVTHEEQGRLTASRRVRREAYDNYLNGRFFWNKRTAEGFTEAKAYFERSIKEDPDFAPAHAGLADVYSLLGSTSYDALPPREAMPLAKAAALKAVKLDEGLAEAHASLGYVLLAYDWDWAGAEREFRRALDLKPSYPTAHQWYAHYLLAQGQTDLALDEMRTALVHDPLSLAISTGVGWCLYLARQYDGAVAQHRKTLEMQPPNFVLAQIMLGMAQERQGSYSDAKQIFQKALAIAPQSLFALARLGHAYAVSGDKREAGLVLERLNEMANTRYVPAVYPGAIYEGMGDMDRAYQYAEKAYADRSHYVIYLNAEPSLDRFRADPRFGDFARRMGWRK